MKEAALPLAFRLNVGNLGDIGHSADQRPTAGMAEKRTWLSATMIFVRTTHSTRLTRAGKLLLEHVPRVFTTLQQARDSVKAAANGFHGQLGVALSDDITPSRFSTFLALCSQEEPEIEVHLSKASLTQQSLE